MEEDIAKQLDSFSLNEEESFYVGLSNAKVESRQEISDRSVFTVIYGGGKINAISLKKCNIEAIEM